MPYPTLRLKPGRERPILAGHPWVFSGAFQAIPAAIEPGDIVDVGTKHGAFVARGYLHPHNSLAFRVLTVDPDELIDQTFFERRVRQASALREGLTRQRTNAYRLVHAEGDGLPGLIVDRYDQWLVVQIHTAGMERQRAPALEALRHAVAPAGILVRNDVGMRAREGLSVGTADLAWGTVPERIEIEEAGVRYLVDPYHGQKTGFFLDQRDKRSCIHEHGAMAHSLLNLFAYTGGFALAGLAANPQLRTVNVDASKAALDLARQNYLLNGHDPGAHEFVASDAVAYLKAQTEARAKAQAEAHTHFDIVVVDPPAYAKSLANKQRALYGYDTLNTLAAQVVAPEGLLLTCSCTGVIDMAEFEAVVQSALLHARRRGQVLASFTVSLDHPTLLGFPEDRYLKALLLRLW